MSLPTRQRAAVNAVGIGGVNILQFIVGLMLVPFMIRHLGKDDYGIYQLVRSFLGYLPLLTLAVGPAVSRYVTYAVGRNDHDAASQYMSTGVAAMGVVAGMLFAAGCTLAALLPRFMDLGEQAGTAQWLLVLLAGASAGVYLRMVFTVPLYAQERLAEQSGLLAAGEVLRAGGIVAAFLLISPALEWVGVSALAGSAITVVAAIFWAYRVFPWMSISPKLVDRKAMRELISFSAFSTINALTIALYYSTDNILIKWLYGAAGPGLITVYSVAAAWDSWLRAGCQPLIRIIMPRMTLLASQDRMDDVRRLTMTAVRYTTVLVAPAGIIISIFAKPILILWLGDKLTAEEFSIAASVLPYLMTGVVLALGLAPCGAVWVAYAKVAAPAGAGLVGAALKLVIGIVLVKYTSWGLAGLALATAVTIALRQVLFQSYYMRRVTGIRMQEFFVNGLLRATVLAAAFTAVCGLARWLVTPRSFLELGLTVGVCGLIYAVAAWAFILRPHDRQAVLNQALRIFSRSKGSAS